MVLVIAGVLALAAVIALALVGVVPDGGTHAWHSIQTAMNSVVDTVKQNGGTHAWH